MAAAKARRWLVMAVFVGACAPPAPERTEPARPDDPPAPMDGRQAMPPTPPAPTPFDAAAPPRPDAAPAPTPTDAAGATQPTASVDAIAPAAPSPETAQTTVPVLWIEVGKAIPFHAKVPGRLKVIENPEGTLDGIAMRPAALNVALGIGKRGNFSSGWPKTAYSIELRDDAGMDREYPFLGMPPGSDFKLYPSWIDQSFMRNPLTLELAREMGRVASRTRFAEVFVDGKYMGLYLVEEAIRRDKHRVPIAKPAPDRASGDVTGGYIFRLEGPGKGSGRDWKSAAGKTWTYHYPKHDRITAEQKAYVHDYVNRFEAMMKGADFGDAHKGYRAWLDVPAWVDFALVQELAKNWDGFWKSHYFTKQSDAVGGKLAAGPPWDFDNTYGMAEFDGAYQTAGRLHVNMPDFWSRLMKDPAFQRDMKCRWTQLRSGGPLGNANITAKLDRWQKLIAAAQARDNAQWKLIGTKYFPVYFVGKTWADYVTYVRTWVDARLKWLDANLPGTCDKEAT